MNKNTKQLVTDALRGSQIGAIIACALDTNREATPRFTSKAIITSDGFVQANFVDRDGVSRHSAFIGSWGDLLVNLQSVKVFLQSAHKIDVGIELDAAISNWVAVDYRS